MAHETDHLLPTRDSVSARRVSPAGLAPQAVDAPRVDSRRPPAVASMAWGPVLCALGLSTADAAALERSARTRVLTQGQPVFSNQERAAAVMLLVQGAVSLGVTEPDGSFRPERALQAPAWLDAHSAWLDGTHAQDARAMCTVTVAEWPREVLAPLLEQRPTLARRLIVTLAREVHDLTLNTHDLMRKDAPARLAAWLHQRCTDLPGTPGQAVVHLNERKRDIASQLAITPETLSRLMRTFMRQGVIEVAGYTVLVLDPAALARLAQGDEVAAAAEADDTSAAAHSG